MLHCIFRILLNGVMSLLHEEYETAGEFFEIATYLHPQNTLSWTLQGRFCFAFDFQGLF